MANKKKPRKAKASPATTAMHKKRIAKKHEKRLEYFLARKFLRDELLVKAKSMTGKTRVELQRMIGTLNVNRLTDIVNGTFYSAPYYLERERIKEFRNAKKSVEAQTKFKESLASIRETMSPTFGKNKKKKGQDSRIPAGRSKSN